MAQQFRLMNYYNLPRLDDGKIYRKALYLMVKTMVSGEDFPLNQSSESSIWGAAESLDSRSAN